MPVRWTADNDQRLLVLTLKYGAVSGVNWKSIADAWATHYGGQPGDLPTERAIKEHIATLQKKLPGDMGASERKLKGAPITPSKPKTGSAPKTPGSSATKRKFNAVLSDEYDSEPTMEDIKRTPARASMPRDSKAKRRSLTVDLASDDGESAGEAVVKDEAGEFDGSFAFSFDGADGAPNGAISRGLARGGPVRASDARQAARSPAASDDSGSVYSLS